MTVYDELGFAYDYDTVVELMDDELREALHAEMSPCSEQEFFSAYRMAHFEKYPDDYVPFEEVFYAKN